MPFTPWRAELSDSSTSAWSCRDMRILLPLIGTPSRQYIFFVHGPENTSYGREVVAWLEEKKSAKVRHSSSVAAVATILSHPGVAFIRRRRLNSTADLLGWVNRNCLKGIMYRVLLRLLCWRAIIFRRVLRWSTRLGIGKRNRMPHWIFQDGV